VPIAAQNAGVNGPEAMRDTRALFLLDNFEHLMAGAPELGTLLSNVARLEGQAMR